MFCSKCGAQVSEDQAHCSNCGAAVNATSQTNSTAQPQYQAVPQPVRSTGKGLGIASMIVGIVSLAFFCFIWLAIVCAIVGIALGGVSIYQSKKAGVPNGMGVAGLTCSCIALGILIVLVIAAQAFIAEMFALFM